MDSVIRDQSGLGAFIADVLDRTDKADVTDLQIDWGQPMVVVFMSQDSTRVVGMSIPSTYIHNGLRIRLTFLTFKLSRSQ